LSQVPAEIDEIIRHTGIAAATVYLVLLELDLAGRLQRHADGRVSMTPD
jgi:DNA processing protein